MDDANGGTNATADGGDTCTIVLAFLTASAPRAGRNGRGAGAASRACTNASRRRR